MLWGPPASGKTSIARALAESLAVPWADVDAAVERDAGCSVAELFARVGEAGFRARERAVFTRLLDEGHARVIAAGGGTLLDRALRHATLRRAHVVALWPSFETLLARARADGARRPLLVGDTESRLHDLLADRAAAYAEVHATVRDDDPARALAAVSRAIHALRTEPVIVVPRGARTSRVHVAPCDRFVSHLPTDASAGLIVTDARSSAVRLRREIRERFMGDPSVVLSGHEGAEHSLTTVRKIWRSAQSARIGRDGVFVGIGGDEVMAVTGFAAATWLRGVRSALLPTTLRAMIASADERAELDLPARERAIGVEHAPTVVVCDPALVESSGRNSLRAGLAELARIALAGDAALLTALARDAESLAFGERSAVARILPDALGARIALVTDAPRAFGEVFARALRIGSGRRLDAGSCLALGMRAALAWGEAIGVTPRDVVRDGLALLDALGVPRRTALPIAKARAMRGLDADTNRRTGALESPVITARGAAEMHPVSPGEAIRALDHVLEIRTRRLPRVRSG